MRYKLLIGIIAGMVLSGCQGTRSVDELPLAVCIKAPLPNEVDRFCEFMQDRLAKDGVSTIVLLIRYNYQFTSHPECSAKAALTLADAKKLTSTARKLGITIIPKMNLMGHQSVKHCPVEEGILKAYPDMDESRARGKLLYDYCHCLCPRHPDSARIACELMDELVDAFEAKAIHIGCDEVFEIGFCERCKGVKTAKLFADWVNMLARHNASRGVETLIWADRLLNAKDTGYGIWEASDNGTDEAINLIDKSIILCDWHYEKCKRYPSVEIFAKAGFRFWLCPWRYLENAQTFITSAMEAENDHALGIMLTTWCSFSEFADAIEGKRTLWELNKVYNAFKRRDIWYNANQKEV